MTPLEGRPDLVASKRIPYGLMSLAEMVNFRLYWVCVLRVQLSIDIIALRGTRDEIPLHILVREDQKEHYKGWLKLAQKFATEFEWEAVKHRAELAGEKLEKDISRRDLAYELNALQETVDKALKDELVYRYPVDRKFVLIKWKDHWAEALRSFPSATNDVFAAVDCWALGHSTAAVFHAMRVLEHGLRALAKDLGKNFDVQNWQNIIEEIEAEIRSLNKTLPRGSAKLERLRFLSEAAKEFVYFKDGWRNYVSHGRGVYDEHQARSILDHVRSFMSGLASELHE